MRLGAKKVEAKFDDWGDDWEKEEPEEEEAYAFSLRPRHNGRPSEKGSTY
jgi:hypothetical protein